MGQTLAPDEFESKFMSIADSSESKYSKFKLLDELINDLCSNRKEEVIISESDIDQLGRSVLLDKIDDVLYDEKSNNVVILVNGNPYYYSYYGNWLVIPYLSNVINGSMPKNFHRLSDSYTESRRSMFYLVKHSELSSMTLLR